MFKDNHPTEQNKQTLTGVNANNELEKTSDEEYYFISAVSHNMFTPLTAIKGYSSLLLEGSFGKISPEYREKTEKIFDHSQKFVEIVEKFLDISNTKEPLEKIKSEFIQLSNGQFLDLWKEIEKAILELREIPSEETNKEVADVIQKISGSSEHLVETIKDFNEVLKKEKE